VADLDTETPTYEDNGWFPEVAIGYVPFYENITIFKDGNTDDEVSTGSEVEFGTIFNCSAVAYPNVTMYRWLYENETRTNGSTVNVTALGVQTYTCYAENQVGTGDRTVEVDVTLPRDWTAEVDVTKPSQYPIFWLIYVTVFEQCN